MKYYNTVLLWDNHSQNLKKVYNFKDRSDFKVNYQVYSGNIFLNHNNHLFVVTGHNYDMFYMYDTITNEIFKISNLIYNHCRGGLVYVEKLKALICVSGKNNNKTELFSLKNMKYPEIETVEVRERKPQGSDESKKESNRKGFANLFVKNKAGGDDELNDYNSILVKKERTKLIDYAKLRLHWEDLADLNIQRHYASLFVWGDKFLYVFFGYNYLKGPQDTIERLNLNTPNEWEYVNYNNDKYIDLRIDSAACMYSNSDDMYILGGCVNENFTDRMLKYNFVHDSIHNYSGVIPNLQENEYFRFWEESGFKSLNKVGLTFSETDDNYSFAMFDARDKLHLFNARNYKYNIVNCEK